MSDKSENSNSEEENESGSLEGKGWDILAGGQDNPFLEAMTSDESALGEGVNPFASDDSATDEVLTATSTEGVSTAPPPTDDAFWDRGRGPESAGPETQTESATEADPRDLSPDDLGTLPEGTAITSGEGTSAHIPGQYDDEESGSVVTAPPIQMEELMTEPDMSTNPGGGGDEVDPVFANPSPVEDTTTTPVDTGPLPTPVAPMFEGGEASTSPVFTSTAPSDEDDDEDSSPYKAEIKPSSIGADDPFGDDDDDNYDLHDNPLDDLPSKPELVSALVTDERMEMLWKEIDELYAIVVHDVRGHYKTTTYALADLKKAREYLMAGKQYFDNAEELVMHAKAKLRLEEKVRQWSRTRGTWLMIYLVIWLMLLSMSSLMTARAEEIAINFGVPAWMAATILPGLWGGVGGVVGALWVLIKHIVFKRDFDPIHTTWFVVNPFMGIVLGILTYLMILGLGMVSTVLTATGETLVAGETQPFMYAICAVVGFRQNVFWKLVDKFTQSFLGDDDADSSHTATETSTPPSVTSASENPPIVGGGAG